MADWTFITADNTTAQTWAKRWWIEAKTKSYFYGQGLVGRDQANSVVVEFPDLEKEQGYQHTFAQVRELAGAGVEGDAMMEGNEEEPDVFDDAITLNQKRNAVRTYGKLSDQYPSDRAVRKWAKELLRRWMAMTIDQDLFTAITASPTKIVYGGDATLTTDVAEGDYFTTNLISKCRAYAEKAQPEIVPVNIQGGEYFIMIISPDQAFDLKTRDATWAQTQREAQKRGNDNPIFKGAEGIWDQVVIHRHKRVAIATTWGGGTVNGATGLFLGVQAAGIAYAKKKIWNEKTFDYGNKVGFCIGSIFGLTKAVFNAADNSVVAVRTFRTSN